MSRTQLKDTLRSMVSKYGFERVNESLMEVNPSSTSLQNFPSKAKGFGSVTKEKVRKSKPRVTASQYVAKMELPSDKEATITKLAGNFEEKSFLPTFGDISNFCQIHNIDEPASKSRTNAIPRLFKFIASMNNEDIQRIIDDGLFSGPSSLGPIADAIRHTGRATASIKSRL